MSKLRVLSLFAGIGGFDLGLERTGGFETVAFCEIEPFAVRVLSKHWPEVPVYGDVRELTAERLRADGIVPDVIVGGFPCQDISLAGKGAGLAGERSGLWGEYARLIGEIRPLYVLVENVAALLSRGLGDVLGDLAALGYDAEWHCIPASAVGAPHRRDRVWIIAHPQHPDANGIGSHCPQGNLRATELCDEQGRDVEPLRSAVADASLMFSYGRSDHFLSGGEGAGEVSEPRDGYRHAGRECGGWDPEPDVGRVVDGLSSRVDELKSLGNAVVPQIPELIGRAILESLAA